MGKIIEILNGDVNSYFRIIFIMLLVGLMSFLFYQVTNIPYSFATKQEVQTIQVRMDDRLDRIESKVDDINRFLRKRNDL